MNVKNILSEFFASNFLLDSEFNRRLVSSLVIFLILWVIRIFINKIVKHQTKDFRIRYNWRKSSLYVAVFLGIILIGRLWIQGFQPILAFMGIVAAALTITQKEAILNGSGFIFILWRDLFIIGDRIEICEKKGDVIGIGIFYFTIMEVGNWVNSEQSTGRLIKVPNSLVLTNPISNYTRSFPFIWDEITTILTFDSNWQKARNIMQEVAEEQTGNLQEKIEKALKAAADKMILFHHLRPKVYVEPVSQSPAGIHLTLRYLCEPRKRRDMENSIWEAILIKFGVYEDISFVEG